MRKTFQLLVALLCLLSVKAGAKTEKIEIPCAKGKLSAYLTVHDLVAGEKCPMVILMHGFMGNKEGQLEKDIAAELEAAGIASIRFDFNGHGESEGEFQHMTVPNEIQDALQVYNYVTALPYVSKVALAGHSQGGVVASMTAGELGTDKVAAVVLMAPAAVLRDDAIRGNTMGAVYNPLDPPEYVVLFGDKKLGGEYIKTAFSLPIYETAARYNGPACIIHGTGDRIVPYTYGERYHQLWPDSELFILDGDDHGFSHDLQRTVDIASDFLIEELLPENATR